MHKMFEWMIGTTFILMSTLAVATPDDTTKIIANSDRDMLAHYLALPENIKQAWVLESKQDDAEHRIVKETYTLTSQTWPKSEMDSNVKLWKHSLVIYRPEVIISDQALLYINGGIRYPNPLANNQLPREINFARIAAATHSVVVDLQDVPNQYLRFKDGVMRKEDGIIAYTWNRYLDDPDNNSYWPGHFPMTKAVVKAMDAVQEIFLQTHQVEIKRFVVAGASKRGWTTWLAALSDKRIHAIVPIVIDILNTQKNINHIYASYNNHWPPAFHDYVEQKVTDRLDSPAFARLMTIEDPIAYLGCDECHIYRERLSMPKYIISASGDDFFVPDSLNLYLDKLPGETKVRVVPNQAHAIDMTILENALLAYYESIINHTVRPTLNWKVDGTDKLQYINTDQRPLTVKLWEAENPNARDFRFVTNIQYVAKELKGECLNNHCYYPVQILAPAKGWKASFVEVTYPALKDEPMVLTTSTYVIGADK